MTFVAHWTQNKDLKCSWCAKCRKECSGNPDLGILDPCLGFEKREDK